MDITDIKSDLGLQELFMFAPTTNKVVINQPTISNMNRVLNKPTTITAKPIVPKFGRDTGTSKLSMNFNPNGNNFGFN